MPGIKETPVFKASMRALRDRVAAARIVKCIEHLKAGNPGDVKPVGAGISEMRIDHGPGYRVYYVQRGAEIIVLLCGGDKKSQAKDIETAKELVKAL
jgi:putative addiction module killer protein